MADAAIRSREEFRDTQRRVERRPRRHDRVEPWLHTREARVQASQPTLEQLTQAVCALRQEVTQAVTEGVVEQAHRAAMEPRTAACPPCGPMWSARGPQDRPVETLVGAVRLRRPSWYGAHGHRGTTPWDEALQVTERRKPPDVQQAAVPWTTALPDETACERCEGLTGLPLSAHTAHEVTPAGAAGWTVVDGAPRREESVATIAAVAAGQGGRPILVLASAGADVPTRPETANGRRPGRTRTRATRARWTGEGREANGFRGSLRADDRRVQVWSGHQVQPDEEAAAALRQVQAAGLLPAAQGRLCVMAEGARGIWKPAQALLPSAVASVDDDHGRAPLHPVAGRPDGAHPERQQPWDEAALARLFWGDVHAVIWGLQRMQPTDAQAAAERATRARSLQRHQERRDRIGPSVQLPCAPHALGGLVGL